MADFPQVQDLHHLQLLQGSVQPEYEQAALLIPMLLEA